MALVAQFSPFYFTRMFIEATGTSPARYLTALRFEEAKRLLTETDLKVAEIAAMVGYESVGTFSVSFKKTAEVPPSVYRQQSQLTRVGGA
jgi:AraC-type DNA-binding domain-containing proteins